MHLYEVKTYRNPPFDIKAENAEEIHESYGPLVETIKLIDVNV